MSFANDQQRKAVMAILAMAKRKYPLRAAARNQKTTQKFLKMMGQKGRIAHPTLLVRGQRVYKLIADPTTKTAGTKKEMWVVGKVTRKVLVGRNIPGVMIQWEKKAPKGFHRRQTYTHDTFKAMSIVQAGGTFAKKDKRMWMSTTMAVRGRDRKVGPVHPTAYSTKQEHLDKEHARPKVIFGAEPTYVALEERRKKLRLAKRAEYMRGYRKKKKPTTDGGSTPS